MTSSVIFFSEISICSGHLNIYGLHSAYYFSIIYRDAIMLLLQIVSCAKCRYKYELVSGDIVSIHSEEIRLLFAPSS